MEKINSSISFKNDVKWTLMLKILKGSHFFLKITISKYVNLLLLKYIHSPLKIFNIRIIYLESKIVR